VLIYLLQYLSTEYQTLRIPVVLRPAASSCRDGGVGDPIPSSRIGGDGCELHWLLCGGAGGVGGDGCEQ
jgi:hypothetical protein